jgi:hypothetical protein
LGTPKREATWITELWPREPSRISMTEGSQDTRQHPATSMLSGVRATASRRLTLSPSSVSPSSWEFPLVWDLLPMIFLLIVTDPRTSLAPRAAIVFAFCGGLLFGLFLAAFYRWSARRLGLGTWEAFVESQLSPSRSTDKGVQRSSLGHRPVS